MNLYRILATVAILAICVTTLSAEEKEQAGGPPPMLVATAEVVGGVAEPLAEFIGTAYYARTAKVAADVSGLVKSVSVSDGETVKKGAPLVTLDDAILSTEISGTQASYEQNQIDLAQATKDFERIARLYQEEAIAETEYESYKTAQSRFEKLSIVLKARLDKLLLEQKKKTIRAPFNGIVIESMVEAGEWVPVGGTVALVADNRTFEVLVDIPADLTVHLQPGREVPLRINNMETLATFQVIIPKGDIATRTFTAKFSVERNPDLIEGMQASVLLPTEKAIDGLLVPRDAVLNQSGRDVIFLAVEGVAKMVPVQVMGYQGMQVSVAGEGLEKGQLVVTKGNERIRDGQPVRF